MLPLESTPQQAENPERRAKADRLLDLIRQLRRRKQDQPLDFYKPLPHQDVFHRSLARTRLLIAANRAGKSEPNVVECCRYAYGRNPYRPHVKAPNVGWVISLSNEAQRDILQPKFERYVAKNDIEHIRYRQRGVWDQLILKNGSIIGFKSCEMGREVLQGTALHWASFDEEPDQDIYDEIMVRLADYRGDSWLSFTPVNGMTWTWDSFASIEPDVLKKRSIEIFRASMWDNARSKGGHIDDDEIRRLEESIPDPAMRAIRIYGEYRSQVGRVYKSFDPNVHCVDRLPETIMGDDGLIKPHLDVYVGIDTGRCFSANFVVVDYFGNMFLFAEYFAEERPLSEHARAVLNIANTYGVSPTYILDRSSQFFTDLAEFGIVPLHADNDVESGISAMQEVMRFNPDQQKGPQYGNPAFYVVRPKCPRFLWEVVRYQWDTPALSGPAAGEKKNAPRKKDDHSMDSARYIASHHPEPSRPPTPEDDNRPIHVKIRDRIKSRLTAKVEERNQSDGLGLNDY